MTWLPSAEQVEKQISQWGEWLLGQDLQPEVCACVCTCACVCVRLLNTTHGIIRLTIIIVLLAWILWIVSKLLSARPELEEQQSEVKGLSRLGISAEMRVRTKTSTFHYPQAVS